MSHHEYAMSQDVVLADFPFYALIMAAMRRADTFNSARLRVAFPAVWTELDARYNAPGGVLPTDPGQVPA